MKKIVSIIVAACLCMISTVCFVGCGEKPYVDKSNAVEPGQFDRPDYAKEMEEKNDATLTHIAIPDDAETVTVDGVEYKPIESLESILHDFTFYKRLTIVSSKFTVWSIKMNGDKLYFELDIRNRQLQKALNGSNIENHLTNIVEIYKITIK